MNIAVKLTAPDIGAPVAPASAREHLGTVLFGLWMTAGLFLDGYFHQNLNSDGESFLTAWHAAFYSGFLASALWLATMARRRAGGSLTWRLRPLPGGYEGARLGLALFAAGGVGDAVWHTAFGVERGIDALLSPTHLLLFAGLVLILTAPVRAAAVSSPEPPGRWIVALSVISTTALVGFFVNFAWGLGIAALARVAYDPVTATGETAVIAGVGSTLVTTVVLFVAARLLIETAAPPGALLVLFGVVPALVSTAFDEDMEGVLAAFAAGVVIELLHHLRHLQWPGGPWPSVPACFATSAALMWTVYFVLLAVLDGVEWETEIWLGAAILNALAALMVAHAVPGAGQSTVGRTHHGVDSRER